MRGPETVVALGLAVVLAGCAGSPAPQAVGRSGADITSPFADAFRDEARGDPAVGKKRYLEALEGAAAHPADPWQLAVVEASLDALVHRTIPSFDTVTDDAALDFRTTGGAGLGRVRADDPFVPGLLARAMLELAERRGDAVEAERLRQRTGCAREATVIGPLGWASVTGVHDPDPLDRFDAKVDRAYDAPGPFQRPVAPVVVRGRGCSIDLTATSSALGVRDVVVDVEVKRAQRIGVALRAHGEATLRAGGKLVLERPYELGGGETAEFARVDAPAGVLRLVARVGLDQDGERLEIDAWDEHGAPLPKHAPRLGEGGTARVTASEVVALPAPTTDAQRLTAAVAALAEGSPAVAERLVEREGSLPNAPPDIALVYARAVEVAHDLSEVHRSERARAAYERVLEVWPTAWEAIVAHAVLAGVRRGRTEARIETLRDLDTFRVNAGPFAAPLLDAFDAVVSGRAGLADRARAAFERAGRGLAGTSLLADAGRFAFDRVGRERAEYACDPDSSRDRRSLDCYDARRAEGDYAGAARELERVRAVLGGTDLFLPLSMRDAIAAGDSGGFQRALGDMLPGEVTLSAEYVAALGMGTQGCTPPCDALRERLLARMTTARDAPSGLPPLLRALADDPTARFEGVADRLAALDRAHPALPSAATAILAHTERYDVDARGVTHGVLFDLRRVSGTTDVEENAQAEPPELSGHTTMRVLRRRIFKKDGRVLEPERAPHASQSHADLSQLEAGDIVEAIYEAWAVPDERGNISIDSPDMLPERTAVLEATIEVRLPASLRGALWSHPMLGKHAESKDEGRRVLVWSMKDVPARRIEAGTPKMDRTVSVSFSTEPWSDVARGLREETASLEEHDPEVAAWAHDALSAAKGPTARAKIEAVTAAAGTAVKEAQIAPLTDIGLGRAHGPQNLTARTTLMNHEGSRTWLIVRALRELGIKAEVAIAENEPYSADPAFPPRAGRFMHPLAIAWADADPVWIDADVQGPPLPAGRISPELRGRNALHLDGSILPIAIAGGDDERDEVDVRLVVDAHGDAKGDFTVILRGKDAQELAEALFRTVGDERQRALRGVALAWVPFANVDDVALSSSEGSWQIAVRAHVTIGAYAQVEGRAPEARTWVLPGIDPLHHVYPRSSTGTLGGTYVTLGQRESALAISRAVQYHAHRRVELPAGATIVRTPGPFEVKTGSLDASRRLSVSGSVLEDDFVLRVTTGTVAADRYGAFVADAHRTDDAFLASTRVKPPK